MLLSAEHLSINFGMKQLLTDVNFYLNEGDKVGIIGINGTGKSTFLKVLAGTLEADAGKIVRNPNVQISYLSQNPVMDDDATILEQIFRNVYDYLAPGGYFIFDLLNEHEVSDSEPFEMDFDEITRVWFQMTRPAENKVNLTIRVYESGSLRLEEVIRETIHDPAIVCQILQTCGFCLVRCADRMLEDGGHGTTWFVIAKK